MGFALGGTVKEDVLGWIYMRYCKGYLVVAIMLLLVAYEEVAR